MEFSSKEDIEAPIDAVFEEITNFQSFERSAIRRGADVSRTDSRTETGLGMRWAATFQLRGKRREVDIELTGYDPCDGIRLAFQSPAIEGDVIVDLVALSRQRTRMSVKLELRPRSLTGRLMLQSLKLARSNITRRFRLRVADYATDVEDRYKRNA